MSDSEMDYSEDSSEDIVFDPDQDPEEKRDLRQSYRSLAKQIEQHYGNPNDMSTDELTKRVEKADELFNKVKGPQEATLDSHLLMVASNLGTQKARAMKSGSDAFDVENFVTKLLRYMGGRNMLDDMASEDSDEEAICDVGLPLEWDRIGRKALAKSHRVPVTGFMLGPLSIEQKKRAVTKRSKLEKNKADERSPQELKEEDIERSQNETAGNIKLLAAILKHFPRKDPINLFEFVINPNDFAQSVENIFYLSFLMRDGLAGFEIRDGVPVVYGREWPEQANYDEGLKRKQMVVDFDMETWRRAIKTFNITEPAIPQRPSSLTKPGDTWYG